MECTSDAKLDLFPVSGEGNALRYSFSLTHRHPEVDVDSLRWTAYVGDSSVEILPR